MERHGVLLGWSRGRLQTIFEVVSPQYRSRSSRLYSLPVGSRGSSASKSMVRGHLNAARCWRQKSISSRSSAGLGLDAGHQLDDGLDLLALVLVGDADDGGVEHLVVGDQEVLGLLRVDVHAARDDHVRLAVGEEQVAVLVDVADVADRRPGAGGVAALGRLGVVVVVGEVRGAVEPDRAGGAGRHLLAVVVEDQQRPEDRRADRARVGQPLLAVAEREAVGLGGAVVLDELGTEPVDHRLLHRHRARRGGVDDDLQRRQVVAPAHVLGQLEHPAEHRRHDLRVGDPVALDGGEVLLGVEALHDHRRRAEAQRARHRRLRGRVVDRRRRQVHHPLAHAEHVR